MPLYWLIDVSGEEESNEVEIWAISEDEVRVIINDRFNVEFYVQSSNQEEDAKSIKVIEGVKSIESVNKNFKGKSLNLLKISVGNARASDIVEEIRRQCKYLVNIFEDDIRFSNQYIFKKGIIPSSWINLDVVDQGYINGYRTLRLNKIVSVDFQRSYFPQLKILAFDAFFYSQKGSPDPERSSIIAISVVTSDNISKVFVGEEKILVNNFLNFIKEFDPDVIVGFNSNRKIIPFLIERSKRIGLEFSLGRLNSVPRGSVHGHQSVRGRLNIDLYDLAEETPEIKLETLEEFTQFLNLPIEYDTVDEYELAEMWSKDRDRVLKYLIQRARGIFEIYKVVDEYIFSLSQLTCIPADYVLTASTGFRVENYLSKLAVEKNEVIPSRKEVVHVSYLGGMVKSPTPGLHKDIVVLDFRSMYPSLMIKYNISFDTIDPNGPIIVPNSAIRFSDKEGFLPHALKKLIEERRRIREKMDMLPRDSPERIILDARQRAVKVISNAIYGYTGWAGARWYTREIAEVTAALGREIILNAIKKAEELKLKIVYGDTDSLFIKNDKKIDELINWVENVLGLEVKVDKIYKTVLFTEAKKKYAGLKDDGAIEIVGLEAIRGDWSEVAKLAQKEVVEAILKVGVEEGVNVARRHINNLVSQKVPLKQLIIWKQITKSLEDYEATAPHVEVAKKLIGEGWKIQPGDKVGYVIVKGTGRLYTRVKPYFKANLNEIDWNYYVEKQVLPVCMRILEVFGIKESDLKSTLGLTAFFQ
ncbi:MAG: DNA-directed DNA polymerase [Nitrososphaeria archaeon]|nr:DNA-directed DNA polymerase [Nitrososphaeria archaeon]